MRLFWLCKKLKKKSKRDAKLSTTKDSGEEKLFTFFGYNFAKKRLL